MVDCFTNMYVSKFDNSCSVLEGYGFGIPRPVVMPNFSTRQQIVRYVSNQLVMNYLLRNCSAFRNGTVLEGR